MTARVASHRRMGSICFRCYHARHDSHPRKPFTWGTCSSCKAEGCIFPPDDE